MDVPATRRGVPAVVIWGALGALVWAVLTVLLGGGSAHADEEADGPLDGVTSLVSSTVSAVTAPVKPVVTQVVAPVVTQVVAPVQQAAPAVVSTVTETVAETPVVGPVAAPVVHAAAETAEAVVAPVTEALSDSPVSHITDPVLGAVSDIPVAGDLVTDLGVVGAVDDVVGVVDDTTALLGDVTDATVPPVLEAIDPLTPGSGEMPVGVDEPAVTETDIAQTAVMATPAVAGTHDQALRPRDPAPASAAPVNATFPEGSVPADDDASAPSEAPSGSLPGTPAPVTPSSAGSGSGAGAAHARVSDVEPSPHRAGERTPGAADDALPASRIADTDVSPD